MCDYIFSLLGSILFLSGSCGLEVKICSLSVGSLDLWCVVTDILHVETVPTFVHSVNGAPQVLALANANVHLGQPSSVWTHLCLQGCINHTAYSRLHDHLVFIFFSLYSQILCLLAQSCILSTDFNRLIDVHIL